jgi:DNA-binding response OmpR family regulator
METILIDQDLQEREFLAYALRQAGLNVKQKMSLSPVVDEWSSHPAALVIIVITNFEETILEIKALRSVSEVPIIVLGYIRSEKESVDLLTAGADLVLNSPVGPRLLASYCHALLRRARTIPLLAIPTLDLDVIALNPSTRTVRVKGKDPIRLTQLEFQLLYVLMTNRGIAIPSDVLVERVWGYGEKGNRELVRGLISRLRSKIESDKSSPSFIHTIPGVGYLFDA